MSQTASFQHVVWYIEWSEEERRIRLAKPRKRKTLSTFDLIEAMTEQRNHCANPLCEVEGVGIPRVGCFEGSRRNWSTFHGMICEKCIRHVSRFGDFTAIDRRRQELLWEHEAELKNKAAPVATPAPLKLTKVHRTQMDYKLLKKYGIDTNEREALIARQDGLCAVPGCKNDAEVVDYDRSKAFVNKKDGVRGVLCKSCEASLRSLQRIGRFVTARLAGYLNKHIEVDET